MSKRSLGVEGFSKRLKTLRDYYQRTQREFASFLNLPSTTYYEYERSRRQPQLEAILKILDRTGVCADWLLLGTGPMLREISFSKLIKDLRTKKRLSEADVAEKMEIPVEQYTAFESGREVPNLTTDFQSLALALDCNPLERERLFNVLEENFRPLYYKSLFDEQEAETEDEKEPQTYRFGKFLEPMQLRKLLDKDEQCFKIYMAQPFAKKAAIVLTILRNGIEDEKIIRDMIYDNFTDLKVMDQVKTILNSKYRDELISFVKFLLFRDEGENE